jgi:hypothetical protein
VISGAVLFATFFFPAIFRSMGLDMPANLRPTVLVVLGVTWFARILFRYRGTFEPAHVGRLLEDLEVSQMRPRAVSLKGKVVGRGEPGAFWSPDLVLRDETGIIYLLYRSSIPGARLLFGSVKADDYVGQEISVDGWFRRGLVPYVEIYKLINQSGEIRKLYSRWIQCGVAAACIAVGLIWLNGGF